MNQKSKILAALGAIVVISGTLIGISIANDQNNKDAGTGQSTVQKKKRELQVEYQGVEGTDALALLKTNYNVETKTFENIGEMVTSINGVTPDSKRFWAFYINDKPSQVGAGSYITKTSDKITWKIEAFKQ